MRFHIYSCQINCVGMCPFSCTAVIECQLDGAVRGAAGEASAREMILLEQTVFVVGWGVGGAEKCN